MPPTRWLALRIQDDHKGVSRISDDEFDPFHVKQRLVEKSVAAGAVLARLESFTDD